MDYLEKFAAPIIVGLLSGGFGSLIGPYINWRIERTKLRHQSRKKKIDEWRTALENAKTFAEVQHTLLWEELKPHMTKAEQDEMFTTVLVVGGGPGSGEKAKLSSLLGVVVRIQKEWELV